MAVGDFLRDPNVKVPRGNKGHNGQGFAGGGCPKHHVRQCQSYTTTQPKRQCGNWASVGADYCKFHRGASGKPNMKGFYSKYAKGRLKEMIEAAGACDEERA